MLKIKLFSVFLALGFILSCKKDAPVKTIDFGYDYYPVSVGHWVVYDVDSIVHNDFTGKIDTFHYQLKEIIESDFEDGAGRLSQRIERYKRENVSDPWQIKKVWFSTVTPQRVERVEENRRFIKLTFAVKENRVWDGNAYNTLDEQEYRITSANVPENINGLSFDSVATVLQLDNHNLIEKQFSEEKYARNIGLIYKEFVDLDLQKSSGLEYYARVSGWGRD